MKSFLTALGLLVGASTALQALAAPRRAPGARVGAASALTIHIRAWIDGRSRLIFDDDTAQWQHFDYAAPGRIGCHIGASYQATYINGIEWWPEWPDKPNCENRHCGGCFSDTLDGLAPAVPDTPQLATIMPISARGRCTIVELPTAANGYRVVVEFDDNMWVGVDWYEIEIVLEPHQGEAYCLSLPNSTGRPATLSALGSLSISSNDTYLQARRCPPDCLGVFFYGSDELEMPFANGFLCVNPFGPSFYRILPAVGSNPVGEALMHLDFPALPPGGAISPGSTWCFQYWFRDPAGGGAHSNLSSGLRVTFFP